MANMLQNRSMEQISGGNHHPVAPEGATPFQMASVAANSIFVVRLKARTVLFDVKCSGHAHLVAMVFRSCQLLEKWTNMD